MFWLISSRFVFRAFTDAKEAVDMDVTPPPQTVN